MKTLRDTLTRLSLLGRRALPPYTGTPYRVGQHVLNNVRYEQLTTKDVNNVFIMKQFPDPAQEQIHDAQLSHDQRQYRQQGYVIKRNFIPNDLIDDYMSLRQSLGLQRREFSDVTPFVEHPAVRDIACYGPLMSLLQELHGYDMGLIFTLAALHTTERGWHSDAYLDAMNAMPRTAVWIALDDVPEDAGPFEYIAGSHRWPALCNQKINQYFHPSYRWPDAHRKGQKGVPAWGRLAEAFVSPAVERKIEEENHTVSKFLAKKGDVLIWYGRLVHQGSLANNPDISRPALIGHYAPLFEPGRGLFAKTADGGHYLLPAAKLDQHSTGY